MASGLSPVQCQLMPVAAEARACWFADPDNLHCAQDDDEEEEASTKVDSTASKAGEPVTMTFGPDGSMSFGDESGPSAGVIPDAGDGKDEL